MFALCVDWLEPPYKQKTLTNRNGVCLNSVCFDENHWYWYQSSLQTTNNQNGMASWKNPEVKFSIVHCFCHDFETRKYFPSKLSILFNSITTMDGIAWTDSNAVKWTNAELRALNFIDYFFLWAAEKKMMFCSCSSIFRTCNHKQIKSTCVGINKKNSQQSCFFWIFTAFNWSSCRSKSRCHFNESNYVKLFLKITLIERNITTNAIESIKIDLSQH